MRQFSTYFLALLLFLSSCGNKNTTIQWHLNQSDHRFYVGQSIALKAKVTETQQIDSLWINIAPVNKGNWEYRNTVPGQDYQDKKTFILERQIDVPDTVTTGKYELRLSAMLHDGKSIDAVEQIQLVIDSSLPTTSDLEIGLNDKQNDLHLAAEVIAAKGIAKVIVLIEGDLWQASDIFDGASLKDKLSAHFHEHIHVDKAPAGDYKVTVILEDLEGRQDKKEGNFSKK